MSSRGAEGMPFGVAGRAGVSAPVRPLVQLSIGARAEQNSRRIARPRRRRLARATDSPNALCKSVGTFGV